MSISGASIAVLSVCPSISRPLIRGYLRAGGPVPRRAWWVVEQLKQRLAPKQSMQVVRIGSGLRLNVNSGSTIGRRIYYHGSYEPGLAWLLRRILRPGMTVIDAGANLGELALRAARRVGPRGRVFAIEASPTTLQSLSENVALNGLANLRVIGAAVGNSDAPQVLFLGREADSLTSSLSPPHDYTDRSATVEGLRLDRLAEQEGLDRVDLIKMDIEGAELAALQGGLDLLGSPAPPIVVFEYNRGVAERAGWSLDDVAALLRPLGYEIHFLGERGIGPPYSTATALSGDDGLKMDLIAVPPGPGATALKRAGFPSMSR